MGSKGGPGGAQGSPKGVQGDPKGVQGKPRGTQKESRGTKKAPRGSPGVLKREPRRRPGYPKRVLGDLFRARWREGRRQLDPPRHAMVLGVLNHLHNPQESGSERTLTLAWPSSGRHRDTTAALKSHPESRSEKVVELCCKSVPN